MLNKRRLGNSDLQVSPIGLGCWQFSKGGGFIGKYWQGLSAETEREIVSASLSAGVNWFDTAEAYGLGKSEQALSAALTSLGVKPGEVVIATKWLPIGRFSRSIGRTIDRRLECLAPYPIDLYQIHFPASFSPVPSQLRAMAALAKAGKIRHVGVSNFSASQMRLAHRVLAEEGIALVSNQILYSLLKRSAETNGVMETAKELGITLIAYSPLAQGVLTGRFHENPASFARLSGMRAMNMRSERSRLERTRPLIEALRRIARERQVTPAEVALNWTLTFHGETVVAIPGASKTAQAEHNARAMSFALTHDELAQIDELSREVVGLRAAGAGSAR